MQVKICGVTQPEDAVFAAQAGADYVGVIFAARSKRLVSLTQAKEIHAALESTTTRMVAVFADETADTIHAVCTALNIDIVQLHGDIARQQLPYLSHQYSIFYAAPQRDGVFHYPEESTNRLLPLFDHQQPGSGQIIDWSTLTPPSTPWILAGGLDPHNVAHAIQCLRPHIVDVASGVEYSDRVQKNHLLVEAFIRAAKHQGNL